MFAKRPNKKHIVQFMHSFEKHSVKFLTSFKQTNTLCSLFVESFEIKHILQLFFSAKASKTNTHCACCNVASDLPQAPTCLLAGILGRNSTNMTHIVIDGVGDVRLASQFVSVICEEPSEALRVLFNLSATARRTERVTCMQ